MGVQANCASGLAEGSDIIKSSNDKKEYRRFTLPNQMTVLLISDPEMAEMIGHEDEQGVDAEDGAPHEDEEGEEGDEEEEEDEEDDDDDDEGDDGEEEGGAGNKGDKKKPAHIKKAAAAMAVGVGSFQDPKHLMGLSHYLEHMLFMGSTKYPDENDYDDFLTKHSGSNNAYTELEYTNYHFDVHPRYLEGALDRFAQFFISPLCLQGSMEREVMAVDSEFNGVMQSDDCRELQLCCHTAKEGHVYRKFSWGNKKSLWDDPGAKGVDIREELLSYYKGHYSAERMNLVVLGGESLDILQGWVEEKFSAVRSGLGARPSVAHEGLPFEGQRIYALPAVKEGHTVTITFQLPSLDEEYRKKAEDFVSHLAGHEGRGSLLSALKAKGLATDVCAGVDTSGYERNQICYLLTISVTLTEAGLAAAPGAGLAAVGVVFQYLKMLQETGPQQWVYDELKGIASMRFLFQEEEDACDYCTRLAPFLHRYPPRDILRSDQFDEFDPELIGKILGLMNPRAEGLRIDIATTKFDSVRQVLGQLAAGSGETLAAGHEPWFAFDYAECLVPEELISRWEEAQPPPEMHLPPRNPYIPTDFTLKAADPCVEAGNGCGAEARAPPDIVTDGPGLRVWHKMDSTFRVPKASAYFMLSSPAVYSSPAASVKSYLLVKLLEDALNEDAYLADTADLSYSAHLDGLSGITIQVYGFNHKLPTLTKTIFKTLRELKVDDAAFGRVKEVFSRKLRNAHMKPAHAAGYMRLYGLRNNMWHTDAELAALEPITAADIQEALALILEQLHIEALLHGNLTKEEAMQLAVDVHDLLGASQMLETDRPVDRVVVLGDEAAFEYRVPVKNPEETNSALESYYQIAPYSTEGGAMVSLLDQLISEKFYDTLRTKEQLGYTVHSGQRLTHGILGFCAVVVSASHTAADLDMRVEVFLDSFKKILEEMPEEEFLRNRAALVANKLMKFTAMVDETDHLWDKIVNKSYAFDTKAREAKALEELSLSDVRAWFADYLAPGGKHRSKLTSQVVGKGHTFDADREKATAATLPLVPQTAVASLDEMKAGLPLFPAFRSADPTAPFTGWTV